MTQVSASTKSDFLEQVKEYNRKETNGLFAWRLMNFTVTRICWVSCVLST